MKKFLNNLKVEAEHIRMSDAEKVAMKANIFGTVSPLRNQPSPYFFFSYKFRMSLAGLLLFMLASSGTVFAAEGALPGDTLYTVKIFINERVEEALAPTTAAKAQVQERLAERRVKEAQTLAAQGRLDEKTAKKLSVDFDSHAKQALALSELEEQVVAPVQVTLAIEATTTPEQEKPSIKKKSGPRDSLRASLKIKAELLKELKTSSQRHDIRDGAEEGN